MDNEEKIDKLAQKIWDYHNIRQYLEKADLIFVLCSNDLRVAEYVSELYHCGWAPYILFSGGVAHQNDLLKTSWNMAEADKFAQIAMEKGVPKKKILIENKATNTGENFHLSYELLKEKKIAHKKIIIAQKPYMLRRAYATFMKQWPGEKGDVVLTSPPLTFQDYPNETISKDNLINIIVGDVERIKIYPEMGFQISQDIPDDVWQAYEELVSLGYTKHLVG